MKKKLNNVFVHESSYVDNNVNIGEGTKIWHFSHILPNTNIGTNCSLGQNVVVGPKVNIGNKVKIQNNIIILHMAYGLGVLLCIFVTEFILCLCTRPYLMLVVIIF